MRKVPVIGSTESTSTRCVVSDILSDFVPFWQEAKQRESNANVSDRIFLMVYYFWDLQMRTLNSYNIYIGKATIANENGSPDGVMMAARITTAQMACLRYFFIDSLVKTPNPDNTATNVGSSKTIPNVMAIDVNKDI